MVTVMVMVGRKEMMIEEEEKRGRFIVKLKWFLGGNEGLRPKYGSMPTSTLFGMLSQIMSALPILSRISFGVGEFHAHILGEYGWSREACKVHCTGILKLV
ncbi:hypothetical protein OWV82_012249 [Melia azedarach]|uniref:Uncharacterized protein n=1 Tax=Melia azedarach TaxID=155640 RepID=A0ACC1Y181_MELAZ|nr:hypothetical protein OWV82_012249 [Melia azedarach]